MNRATLALLAGLGSAGLLAGAYYFQYIVGLAPCALCLQQRWPHFAAAALGIVGFALPKAVVLLAGALAAAASGVIGVFHTGVERGWWEGPSECSGNLDFSQMTADQLLDAVLAAPVVRCTDVTWEMAGLSMASWNAILSFALAGVWLFALARGRA